MNASEIMDVGINGSSQIIFSNNPPPGAPWGWPGCWYPLPLPKSGPYTQAAKWIWKTVPLCLILLGTVGNILTALVIFRNFRKLSSTAVYLLSLAFADTLFLFNAPLKRFVFNVFGITIGSQSNIGCKISMFLTYSSFHLSAWILVAVTIERAVSVIWPYKVKRRCTQRIAIFITVGIVMAVFAMDSHIIYGFGISQLEMYKGLGKCMPIYEEYSKFYIYQWFWVHFIFGFAIPFFFIVIGNTLVIRGLRKMRMRQKWMDDATGNGKKQRRRHRHGHHAKTLMIILILLNTIFFISQTPLAIFLVYYPYLTADLNKMACSDIKSYLTGIEKMWFWEAVTHTFGYLNASINFVLYVVSGSKFRKEIVSLLMCRDALHLRSASSVSPSSISDGSGRRHQRHSRSSYHVNS